jgi:hypothetical protein
MAGIWWASGGGYRQRQAKAPPDRTSFQISRVKTNCETSLKAALNIITTTVHIKQNGTLKTPVSRLILN